MPLHFEPEMNTHMYKKFNNFRVEMSQKTRKIWKRSFSVIGICIYIVLWNPNSDHLTQVVIVTIYTHKGSTVFEEAGQFLLKGFSLFWLMSTELRSGKKDQKHSLSTFQLWVYAKFIVYNLRTLVELGVQRSFKTELIKSKTERINDSRAHLSRCDKRRLLCM